MPVEWLEAAGLRLILLRPMGGKIDVRLETGNRFRETSLQVTLSSECRANARSTAARSACYGMGHFGIVLRLRLQFLDNGVQDHRYALHDRERDFADDCR